MLVDQFWNGEICQTFTYFLIKNEQIEILN